MKQMDEQWRDLNMPENFNFWQKCKEDEFSLYEIVAFQRRTFMVVEIELRPFGGWNALFYEIGGTISQEQVEEKVKSFYRMIDCDRLSKLRERAKERGVEIKARSSEAFREALANDVRQRLMQIQVSE